MDNQGWILIHRKLLDTSFAKQPLTIALFLFLLLKANHQEKKFLWNKKEIVIARGQLVTGRKSLSEQTGISQQSVRTSLVNLISTSTITSKTYNKFSIITILNYNQYQQSTSKLTSNQPATNQQLTTNNNDKNEKNDKNNTVFVEKIVSWAYERARGTPSCSKDAFRRSVLSAINKYGEVKVEKAFELEENAITFLQNIKTL